MDTLPDFSFDGWTFQRSSGELRRGDVRVRLPIQSARVLDALLVRPGELVPRETFIASLWPRGVVEYDTALNTIVHRLRVALGDHAGQPRYIETIPRRGYRFIGRVETPAPPPPQRATETRRAPLPHAVATRTRRVPVPHAVAAATLVLLFGAAGSVATFDRLPGGQVAGMVQSSALVSREKVARARMLLQRRGPGDVASAERLFRAAVAADPRHADAWAGLASAHWLDVVEGRTTADDGIPRVIEAAGRALQIDDRSAEAHMRMAGVYWRRGEPTRAEDHLRLARLHDPGHPLVLAAAIAESLKAGRLAEAIELQRRSVVAEPLAVTGRQNLVALLVMADRLDEATVENERIRELHPTAPWLQENRVEVLVLRGRFEEALVLARDLPEPGRHFYAALALHGLGRRAESEASLRRLIDTAGDREPIRIIEAMAYRGDREEAITRLVASTRTCTNPWVRFSPYLHSLRSDPRWEAWVKS